jgi:hypothetical protein
MSEASLAVEVQGVPAATPAGAPELPYPNLDWGREFIGTQSGPVDAGGQPFPQ